MDPVQLLHVSISYYKLDGTFIKTVTKDATVPGQMLYVLPHTTDGADAEGSIKVTANIPFLSFTMGQSWNKNYATNSLLDFGFAKPNWLK
jgi:hypothetical protein